ncbi:MAG: class I SAM-dependent methyltransferase [Pseudomonadota bacterium]
MTYRASSDAHYASCALQMKERWSEIDQDHWLAPIARNLRNLPHSARILDVGAGTGRLAAHLAARGHRVTAVEPVDWLWQEPCVPRIPDDLPGLARVKGPFDAILALGVLHHLPPAHQHRGLARMAELIAPGGALIIAARHGPGPRPRWPIRVRDLNTPALRSEVVQRRSSIQAGNRSANVKWTWIVFQKRRKGIRL